MCKQQYQGLHLRRESLNLMQAGSEQTEAFFEGDQMLDALVAREVGEV